MTGNTLSQDDTPTLPSTARLPRPQNSINGLNSRMNTVTRDFVSQLAEGEGMPEVQETPRVSVPPTRRATPSAVPPDINNNEVNQEATPPSDSGRGANSNTSLASLVSLVFTPSTTPIPPIGKILKPKIFGQGGLERQVDQSDPGDGTR